MGGVCVFLPWQIPEEHDLESQIRKEREWRFLRNARVRKQAQKIIQKGECSPCSKKNPISHDPN